MRSLRLWLVMVVLAFAGIEAHAAPPLPQPKLIAVYFYADWCVNCKVLSASLKQAREQDKLDDKAVLFVTFDLTNPSTIHQSILHAQALGLGAYMRAQGSATGYVAVLDAASKKELTRFDRAHDSAAIAKGMTQLLAD